MDSFISVASCHITLHQVARIRTDTSVWLHLLKRVEFSRYPRFNVFRNHSSSTSSSFQTAYSLLNSLEVSYASRVRLNHKELHVTLSQLIVNQRRS